MLDHERPQFVGIDGKPELVKDTRSGALLNTDVSALKNYKRQKKLLQTSADDRARITALEADVRDMKALLKQILEKVS